MKGLHERLRAELKGVTFQAPASERQIAAAEEALRVRLPGWLRDLYARTNGLLGPDGAPYLYALDLAEGFPESLVSWNAFLRAEWQELLPSLREDRPEVRWEEVDPNRILVIGRDLAQEQYAVDPRARGTEILGYSEQEEERFEVIAPDLLELLRRVERRQAASDALLVNRTPYRGQDPEAPPERDIELVWDELVIVERGTRKASSSSRLNLDLFRVPVERPDARAELYAVWVRGPDIEVRIATRDGAFPFVMTVAAKALSHPRTCLVHGLHAALLRLMQLWDWSWFSNDEAELERFWTDRAGIPDDELRRIAAVLCAEDDRRRS